MKFLSFRNLILVLFSVTLSVKSQNEAEVRYYTNLINDEIERSQTRTGPQDAREFLPTSNRAEEFGNFDYIVIGAGSAGAVVASRLSEVSSNKVLLIEAGGQETNFTDIPAISYYLLNSEFTWNMKTVPQRNGCLGMVNRQCNYPRGRGLGGTSITNSLNYVRGNKRDYNSWEQQGNPGWSYKDVFPLFLKSERANFPHDPKYHNRQGELSVEYEQPNSDQFYAFVDANVERGRKFIDYNAEEQIGVGQVQFNTINGRRDSTNKAFLRPAYNRPNLKIITHSYVTKIDIDKRTKTAYGVTFSHRGKVYIARAKKEIVLSAGTFHSAQILMLSGIGPTVELRKHGIPILQPLAVGENLQDHNGYLALIFRTNVTRSNPTVEEQVRNYLRSSGDLTFAINSQAVAWFQTRLEKIPDYPDIEVIMVTSNNTSSFVQDFNNYNDETYNAIWAGVDPTVSFTTSLLLMHPRSRGTVRLSSSNPYEFPLVDSNFYSDPGNLDMETMYEGIRIVLDLIDTEAFRRINATLYPTTSHPQCQRYSFNTKDYWYCQLRFLTIPFYHPVGTCKMGPDPQFGGAVVNHKLQVHGIKNLRVADASIMPTAMTGHTHAPTVMIGEKAAQLILSENPKSNKLNKIPKRRPTWRF